MKQQQPNKSLEQQIVDGLAGETDSATLALLIQQTHTAIANCETTVHTERSRITTEPLVDVKIIRDAINDAQFRLERFQALLPKLAAKLAEVERTEAHLKWLGEYEAVKTKIAAAAEHWIESYPDAVADIINLIRENQAFEADILRINMSAPSGEPRRLRSPELTARNEPLGTPSILADLKLIDLDGSVLWPLPMRIDPSLYAPQTGGGDPRLYTDRWHEVHAEARARRAAEEEEQMRQNSIERDLDYGRQPAAE